MGGGNKGRGGMMGMELQSGDSKHPLFVHMEGGEGGLFLSRIIQMDGPRSENLVHNKLNDLTGLVMV